MPAEETVSDELPALATPAVRSEVIAIAAAFANSTGGTAFTALVDLRTDVAEHLVTYWGQVHVGVAGGAPQL